MQKIGEKKQHLKRLYARAKAEAEEVNSSRWGPECHRAIFFWPASVVIGRLEVSAIS